MVEQLSEECSSRDRKTRVSASTRRGSSSGKASSSSNSSVTPARRSSPPFDIVLACDVLYEKDAVEPIAKLLPK